jgi:chromosome segregation ATPase
MGLRDKIREAVSGHDDEDLRRAIDDMLSTRSYVRPGELHALRQRVDRLEEAPAEAADPSESEETTRLQARVRSLEKKLDMAMGAIQAATSQIADLRNAANEARSAASTAAQQATSATATAEAAVDGVTGVEAALSALTVRIAGPDASPPAATSTDDKRCATPGCRNKARRRGLCDRHYRELKSKR